jgi:ribosome-associated protein
MLVITPHVKIPLEEFQFTFSRSSGPGGQNVNKVNTKAQLRWCVVSSPSLSEPVRARLLQGQRRRLTADGDLLITSQRFRDAPRNREDCLEKLRQILLAAVKPPRVRKPTRPTRGSIRRRIRAKQQRSLKKQDRRTTSDE